MASPKFPEFYGDPKNLAPVLGLLWSPLAAVTVFAGGQANAQICVSIAAASIVPERPRVLAQIYKRNHSHGLIWNSGAFAVNFLGWEQLGWIKDFGLSSGRDVDKLAGRPWEPGPTGSPVLRDAWAYLDCRVVNAMDGGDLTCFLAEVAAGGVLRPEGGPLAWREARRLIPEEWRAAWERKQAEEITFSRRAMSDINYEPWRRAGDYGTGN